MVKSIVKTVINAIWVILVCLEISQVISQSQAFGYILISIYIGVLIIFRPMRPLYKAIRKPDINIPVDKQISNHIYSLLMLTIKVGLLIACSGISVSGAILYRVILFKSFAIKLHLLFVYWTFITSSVQLGINISLAFSPFIEDRVRKHIYYSAIIVSIIGCGTIVYSGFVRVLFKLSEKLVVFSLIQVFLMLIGFVSFGIVINHLLRTIVIDDN